MRKRDRMALVMLGALEPRTAAWPVAVRAAGARADRILRWQKAVGISAERLARLTRETGDPAVAALHSRVAATADETRRRAARLDGTDARVAALGLAETYLIKGLAFRTWYADPHQRDVGDLDLWIPDIDEAWRLTAALRAEGWTYQRSEPPWFKRDTRRGEIYGQIRMWAGPDDADSFADIHFGPFYSVRHCAVMPLRRPERGRVMPPADNLAAMVGNAANDHFITVKDLNDLYLALRRDDVDWDRLLGLLRGAGIARFFQVMLARLAGYFVLDPGRADRLESLRGTDRREFPAPSRTGWGRTKRWLATVAHARRMAATAPGLPAARTVRSAAVYYARRRPVHVVASVRRPVRVATADNATCVRLFPSDAVAGADRPPSPATAFTPLPGSRVMTVASTLYGDIVRCGTETFLPTVGGAVDGRLLSRALVGEPVGGEP